MKTLTILGSTGTIGQNTLDLVARHPDAYGIRTITAGKNSRLLIEQAKQFKPQAVVIEETALYPEVRDALSPLGIQVSSGIDALNDAASQRVDLVMHGIVGAAGIAPMMAAVEAGNTVGLANKESLVCAGELIQHAAQKSGATILPVDSEHHSIHQLFPYAAPDSVSHITLTASGGPLLRVPQDQWKMITPAQAIKHPNWTMGAKISVDSATMMNKGLEIIEAFHLFPLQPDQIRVLVHPESIVHGMIHYADGAVTAAMSTPDMRVPIAYALGYPERITTPCPTLDFAALGTLSFEALDGTRFRGPQLAYAALKAGGSAATILNTANEVAVAAFLAGEIAFTDIVSTVETLLDTIPMRPLHTLEEVLAVDAEVRSLTAQHLAAHKQQYHMTGT